MKSAIIKIIKNGFVLFFALSLHDVHACASDGELIDVPSKLITLAASHVFDKQERRQAQSNFDDSEFKGSAAVSLESELERDSIARSSYSEKRLREEDYAQVLMNLHQGSSGSKVGAQAIACAQLTFADSQPYETEVSGLVIESEEDSDDESTRFQKRFRTTTGESMNLHQGSLESSLSNVQDIPSVEHACENSQSHEPDTSSLVVESEDHPDKDPDYFKKRSHYKTVGTSLLIEYVCDECVFCTGRLPAFKDHIYAHKNIRNYACPKCPDRFVRRSQLTKHLKSHDVREALNCTRCPYNAKHAKALESHQKCHDLESSGEVKIFRCEVCFYLTVSLGTYNRHIATHVEENNLACTYSNCSQTFKTSEDLKVHLNTHRKPYECKECVDYRSATLHLIKQHLKNKHNIRGSNEELKAYYDKLESTE